MSQFMCKNYAGYTCPYADDSELALLESILTGVDIDSLTMKEFVGLHGGARTSVEVFLFFSFFPYNKTICFLSHSPLCVGRRRTSGPDELLRTQGLSP